MLKEKGFYKGVNLGGWFSQCDYSEERLNNFITEADFKIISNWKLDHVRIPVDYNIFENDDGTYKDDGFERIDRAFELCAKYGLNTVLDLHKTAGFSFDSYGENESGFFDSEELQERFYRLWEKFAVRYGNRPDSIAFELLNEVTDKEYIEKWNRIAETCIKRIRVYAPDTIILVGSYWNNSAEAVKDLEKPYDNKVVYNFHSYDPLKFTHQGAYWTDMIDPNERIAFEDSGVTEEYFEKFFAEAIETAKKNGTVLYCGEYGIINKVSPEDTLKWFKCINAVFNKHDIARSAWSYKEMDFGLSDARLDGIRDELLKYL
ncbi:MAG: cellulase family glycosylhydrolase [Oscillospiraceae bacterium]|nr:cellulase family glycosylhydrolase [Oscillospiraceae bacterium]